MGKNDTDDQQDTNVEELAEQEEAEVQVESNDDELTERLRSSEEKYKRALADYQNLEKRNREERSEWIRTANREVLLRILPVLDTLHMALSHEDNPTLKVSVGQFQDVLRSEGVTKIDTVGKKFDPHLMECLEKKDEGETVIEEVRAGYMLHDRLLRPAQVRVGKK